MTICLKCLHKDPAGGTRRPAIWPTICGGFSTASRSCEDERPDREDLCLAGDPSIAALVACVLLVLVAGIVVSSYFAYSASQQANESSRLATVALKA